MEHCSETVGIAVGRNAEHQQMTSFVNEDCDMAEVRQAAFRIPKENYKDVPDIMDIKQYFARPRVVYRGVYDVTVPSEIYTRSLDNVSIQDWFNPYFDRLEGAFGWRGTIVLRLQMIAQPFQAGRLKLVFSPFDTMGYQRTTAITPVSQLPGVEIDIAETTSAVLKIPFVHPRSFFTVVNPPVIEDDQKLGRFGIFAYTPQAVAAGTPVPQFVLWACIEDFEIIGAGPIQYQSGSFSKKLAASAKEEKEIPGNLSNVLAAGSKLLMWGGSKIPFISSYAGATSHFLREAANVAASYGWSKPLVTTSITRMQNTYNGYQFNADGADPAYNLGGFADNSIMPMPGFAGSDLDEMSFDYLKKIYSAINIVNLAASDAPNNIIYSARCAPMCFFKSPFQSNVANNPPDGFTLWPSTLMGLSNCFRLFRGGFKFRLKISKTKFHTGRLLIGFSPVDPLIENVSSNRPFIPNNRSDLQFKSKIWDLREQNTMDFEVPFLSAYPFVDVDNGFGSFFVSVIEPLRGPDTVAQSVPMVIEVAGADDFEVAVPWTGRYGLSPLQATFYSQSGDFEPFRVPPNPEAAADCIGERFNSVKQLISRASLYEVEEQAGSVNLPFQFGLPNWQDPDVRNNLINYDPTMINYWSAFYGLYRGSRVYHGITFGDTSCLTGYYTYGGTLQNFNWNALITENRTGLHMKLPYYCPTSRSITISSEPFTQPQVRPFMNLSTTADSTKAAVFMRAGDDFQYGYYLGCPPLTPVVQNDSSFNTTSAAFIDASIEDRQPV